MSDVDVDVDVDVKKQLCSLRKYLDAPLGLVHGYDQNPKRLLFETLKSQGLQANAEATS